MSAARARLMHLVRRGARSRDIDTRSARPEPAVELQGHHQAVPRRRGQPRHPPHRPQGHGARHRRRERRRQVHPDEDPLRHAAAGRGHHRRRRRAGHLLRRRATPSPRGIGMVHQHFMLADNLTVLENVVLGSEKLHGIGAAGRRAGSRRSPTRYGLGVEPDALVEDLGVGDRQRVEILKVLYRGARILILDEPTAVLVPQEVDELFDNLRELKAEGLTVIFISHKLDEVLVGRRRRSPSSGAAPRSRTVDPGRVTAAPARRADGRQRAALARRPASRPSPTGRCSPCEGLTAAATPRRPRRSLDDVDVHHPQGRGRSASPGSRATARPSWSRRSWACAPRHRHDHPRRRGHHRAGPPASAARPASATSPRTGTGTACCWRPRSGRTASSAT